MYICIDCRAASRPRSGVRLRNEVICPDHARSTHPRSGGWSEDYLAASTTGQDGKAHATTTALWMRSYGSVLVRVPAFG